jgi:hypothetical protein
MTGNIWIDQQASFAEIEVAIFAAAPMADELPHISPVGNAMGQRGPRGAIDDSLNRMRPRSRRQRRLAGAFVRRDGAFVRREDVSKITSTLYLTVDQGTACAALHTPEARPRSCPTLSSTDRANNWMQDFAWDPLKDQILMTQNIRTSNRRKRSGSTGSALLMIKVCGTSSLEFAYDGTAVGTGCVGATQPMMMISHCHGRNFSRFRPGARRCGEEPFDGRGDTSPARLRQPRQIQAQR